MRRPGGGGGKQSPDSTAGVPCSPCCLPPCSACPSHPHPSAPRINPRARFLLPPPPPRRCPREQIDNLWLRRAAKVGAAYRTALRPRLLVLVGLAAALGAYNAAAPEPLPVVYEGCLLGGFLSYKVALLVKLFDELTPKVRWLLRVCGGARARVGGGAACAARALPWGAWAGAVERGCWAGVPRGALGASVLRRAPSFPTTTPPHTQRRLLPPCLPARAPANPLPPRLQSFSDGERKRPTLEAMDDGLDLYGRPKKSVAESPLAVMPEDQRAKAEQQLEKDLEREARRRGEPPSA